MGALYDEALRTVIRGGEMARKTEGEREGKRGREREVELRGQEDRPSGIINIMIE